MVDKTAALRWAVLTVGLAVAVGLSAYWPALASRPGGRAARAGAAAGPAAVRDREGPEVSPAVRGRAHRGGRNVCVTRPD
jgi:hypothetical protein